MFNQIGCFAKQFGFGRTVSPWKFVHDSTTVVAEARFRSRMYRRPTYSTILLLGRFRVPTFLGFSTSDQCMSDHLWLTLHCMNIIYVQFPFTCAIPETHQILSIKVKDLRHLTCDNRSRCLRKFQELEFSSILSRLRHNCLKIQDVRFDQSQQWYL